MHTNGQQRYISADSHVFEPTDLWTTRMDTRFRDRAPHTVSQPEGDLFCSDGLPPAAIAGFFGAMVNDKMTGSGEVTSPMRRNAEVRPGAGDPIARLSDQDLDHVCAEVLYPGTAIFLVALPDAEYQRECFRVYNDWIIEFCRAVPQRLIGTALLPFGGPIEWTVAEAERVARLGLQTVIVPHDIPYHDPQYQPLWTALQDLEMLVAIHPGGTSKPPFEQFGITPPLAWVTQNKQGTMLQGLSGLLASAVPQHYP
ncbi:MAG: amidohydrolase family protein, partial [Candidatus Binatia bacterium]